jgi:hypothetical protein
MSALVFVGDALEESPDVVLSAASALSRLDVTAFMFQEGHDRLVEQTFQDIARLTHGAYCRFDPSRPSIGRAPTRSRGLCYRRTDSTCRPAQCQRGQAPEPAEVGRLGRPSTATPENLFQRNNGKLRIRARTNP